MRKSALAFFSLFAFSLTPVVPAFAEGAWRSVGPGGGGWIQSLAFSRHSPNRLFVGCDVGGFYCSEDRGRHYEMRNSGFLDRFVEDIAEHPTDPDTLLIASHGIYKTTDRGRTWTEKRMGFPDPKGHSFSIWISKIVYNERSPSEVYAAVGWPRQNAQCKVNEHLYLSSDGGESWRAVQTEGLPDEAHVNDLAVDPRDFRKLLVATPVGVFASDDGGRHWTKATGLPSRAQRLAQCPANPDIVYVTIHTVGGAEPWVGGVYRSDDGGKTFVERNGGLSRRAGQPGKDMTADGYDRILVDPTNPDDVLVAGNTWYLPGVFRTTDGGRSWTRIAEAGTRHEPGDGWVGTLCSPGAKSFARSPLDPKVLAVGTDFVVQLSEDGGKTWEQRYTGDLKDGRYVSTGLETTCVREIVPDRFKKGRFHFAYLDIGAWTTDDNGKTMRATFVNDNHSCWALAQSPSDPNLFWQFCGRHGPHASSVERFLVSHDGCRTWQQAMVRDCEFLRTQTRDLHCLSRRAPYRLIARNRASGLVVSEDGGANWEVVPESVLPVARSLSKLAFAQGVVYASGNPTAQQPGSLWRSRDFGRTWEKLPEPTDGFGLVNEIAVEGKLLFLTCGEYYAKERHTLCKGAAWLSEDGGETWRRVREDRGCRCCAISKGRLLLGIGGASYYDRFASGDVLMSGDLGKTWVSLGDESVKNPTFNDIAVDPFDPDSIWVATQGNSVFMRRLPQGTKGEQLTFTGRTDRHPLSYAVGETMTFTVWLVDKGSGNAPVKGRKLVWKTEGDDGAKQNGEATSDEPLVVRTSVSRPGFVRLTVNVLDADGKVLTGKCEKFDGSAGADVEKIEATVEPADFDAFWAKRLAAVAAFRGGTMRKTTSHAAEGFEVRTFSLPMGEGESPATGFIAWPVGAKPKTLRIDARFHSYGFGPVFFRPNELKQDAICLSVTRQGEEIDREKAYYDELKRAMQNFCFRNTDSPDSTDQLQMLLRDWRALQWAKTLPEWNGKDVAVAGGSMGGFQSLAMAALDPGVTSAWAYIPWHAGLAGKERFGRLGGWAPAWTEALGYFDTANFAARIKCPVTMTIGLGDYVCPPSGEMVLFRNLKGEKKMTVRQNMGHGSDYGVETAIYVVKGDLQGGF